MKIGLLISGSLGLEILKVLSEKQYQLSFILTDTKSKEIINLAENLAIPLYSGNPRSGRSSQFISGKIIDVLLSVNYLFLIERDLINLPKLYAVNFHGSLLPKYRGRTPHVWAIINNEKKTGITAHLIDEGCDTGDIIDQIVIDIAENHTGADILDIYREKYPEFILNVLYKIERNNITFIKQIEHEATYFGKRSPNDGQINWNWQKERIYNWVRALAFPYPGAFTYFKDNKIVVNRITFSNIGYNFNDPNGLVLLSVGNPVIKTPNGAVELLDYNVENNIRINKGNVLK